MPSRTGQPPKSILKKPTAHTPSASAGHAATPDASAPTSRNYQLAVQHATLIQARKDIEALILAALEEFIEFPTSPSASASHPSAADVARFQTLIQPFQTFDYDELFEERNLVEKCGYIFCPRERRREPHRGPVRLARGAKKGEGLRILNAKQTEMWCSDECARRALFIKVQLGETPAWERLGGLVKPIAILDESGQGELEEKMGKLDLVGSDGEELEKAMEQLALERGEMASSVDASNKMQAVLAEELVEKPGSRLAVAPDEISADDGRGVEGYRPSMASSPRP